MWQLEELRSQVEKLDFRRSLHLSMVKFQLSTFQFSTNNQPIQTLVKMRLVVSWIQSNFSMRQVCLRREGIRPVCKQNGIIRTDRIMGSRTFWKSIQIPSSHCLAFSADHVCTEVNLLSSGKTQSAIWCDSKWSSSENLFVSNFENLKVSNFAEYSYTAKAMLGHDGSPSLQCSILLVGPPFIELSWHDLATPRLEEIVRVQTSRFPMRQCILVQ